MDLQTNVEPQCADAQARPALSGDPELTADFVRSLPGGKLDDSTYEAIEDALDRAEAPCTLDGRWLTLAERVDALAAENFKLAAGACKWVLGNEHGNAYCGDTGKLL
jgi:hypothetical protein